MPFPTQCAGWDGQMVEAGKVVGTGQVVVTGQMVETGRWRDSEDCKMGVFKHQRTYGWRWTV